MKTTINPDFYIQWKYTSGVKRENTMFSDEGKLRKIFIQIYPKTMAKEVIYTKGMIKGRILEH